MALITKPKTLSNGTVAQATDVESNFTTIYNDYNGNIDASNLSASAAIADSQLSAITTYGKVTGASLSGLASIASAAGVIPAVNIPLLAGLSTASTGSIPYSAANTSFAALACGASGTYLMSTGITSVPVFSALAITPASIGVDCGSVNATGDTATLVTFNFTFSSAPKVVATYNIDTGTVFADALGVFSTGTTGCFISNPNDTTRAVNWIAVGIKA